MQHTKFHTNMRNNLITVRSAEHWNRLPREVVDSPSLMMFKTHMDAFLCNINVGKLHLDLDLGKVISRSHIQPL